VSAYTKPLPDVADPLVAPFWEGTRQSRLVVQTCSTCGYRRWPPGLVCPECQSPDSEWTEVDAAGELYSYATYHRALDKAFSDDVPYSVGLIQLDSGPRMLGTMRNPEEELRIGGRVRAVFEAVTPEVTFVRWAMEDTTGQGSPEAHEG
jgi:uncharacterized protein